MIIGNREGAYPPIVSEAKRDDARGLAAVEPIITETGAGRKDGRDDREVECAEENGQADGGKDQSGAFH